MECFYLIFDNPFAFSHTLRNSLGTLLSSIDVCTAYYYELPHGAGLIMISKAYFTHFIEKHACDDRFVRMAQALGMKDAAEPMDFITALVKLQEDCGVADLKMSDYGIWPDEFPAMAQNARDTMGGLFGCDRVQLSNEDCVAIFEKSYR
ncbi:MAG TPA: iron-containing alcohol dehydrogenase [Clostridiales bacterium]|nr:iron-containing alcohol dehydrogenase [Clostridiales bacterium]